MNINFCLLYSFSNRQDICFASLLQRVWKSDHTGKMKKRSFKISLLDSFYLGIKTYQPTSKVLLCINFHEFSSQTPNFYKYY